MAIDYTGKDTINTKPEEQFSAVPHAPALAYPSPNARLQPTNRNLPPNQPQVWRDTVTGQTYQGQMAANNPSQLIIGFSRGNVSNTTAIDLNTGQKIEADPHPWRDAALHTAMIWGGPETAGVLSGAFGGAGAASAASGGSSAAGAGGTAAAGGAGGAAGAVAPTVAAGGAAGGVGAAGATGGALSALGKWLPIVQGATATIGGIEAGRRAGQQTDAFLANAENQDALEIARQKALADAGQVNQQIAQKSLQAGDYQRNLKNAIQAGLLDPVNGVQDINFNLPDRIASHMGTVTGGLRPSAISNRGAISSAVGPQALEALSHNPTTNDLLPPAGYAPPNLTPYPSATGLDTGLGIASLVGSGLSAFSQLWPRPAAASPIMGGNATPQPGMNGVTFAPSQTGTNPLYTVPRAFQGVNFYGR